MLGTVIEGCSLVTMDARRRELAVGHVVVEGNRICAVADGPVPDDVRGGAARVVAGCLLTPGLVNTHNHLYQLATRGPAAEESLFEWLTALYPGGAASTPTR